MTTTVWLEADEALFDSGERKSPRPPAFAKSPERATAPPSGRRLLSRQTAMHMRAASTDDSKAELQAAISAAVAAAVAAAAASVDKTLELSVPAGPMAARMPRHRSLQHDAELMELPSPIFGLQDSAPASTASMHVPHVQAPFPSATAATASMSLLHGSSPTSASSPDSAKRAPPSPWTAHGTASAAVHMASPYAASCSPHHAEEEQEEAQVRVNGGSEPGLDEFPGPATSAPAPHRNLLTQFGGDDKGGVPDATFGAWATRASEPGVHGNSAATGGTTVVASRAQATYVVEEEEEQLTEEERAYILRHYRRAERTSEPMLRVKGPAAGAATRQFLRQTSLESPAAPRHPAAAHAQRSRSPTPTGPRGSGSSNAAAMRASVNTLSPVPPAGPPAKRVLPSAANKLSRAQRAASPRPSPSPPRGSGGSGAAVAPRQQAWGSPVAASKDTLPDAVQDEEYKTSFLKVHRSPASASPPSLPHVAPAPAAAPAPQPRYNDDDLRFMTDEELAATFKRFQRGVLAMARQHHHHKPQPQPQMQSRVSLPAARPAQAPAKAAVKPAAAAVGQPSLRAEASAPALFGEGGAHAMSQPPKGDLRFMTDEELAAAFKPYAKGVLTLPPKAKASKPVGPTLTPALRASMATAAAVKARRDAGAARRLDPSFAHPPPLLAEPSGDGAEQQQQQLWRDISPPHSKDDLRFMSDAELAAAFKPFSKSPAKPKALPRAALLPVELRSSLQTAASVKAHREAGARHLQQQQQQQQRQRALSSSPERPQHGHPAATAALPSEPSPSPPAASSPLKDDLRFMTDEQLAAAFRPYAKHPSPAKQRQQPHQPAAAPTAQQQQRQAAALLRASAPSMQRASSLPPTHPQSPATEQQLARKAARFVPLSLSSEFTALPAVREESVLAQAAPLPEARRSSLLDEGASSGQQEQQPKRSLVTSRSFPLRMSAQRGLHLE